MAMISTAVLTGVHARGGFNFVREVLSENPDKSTSSGSSLVCKIRLDRGPATLSHKNQLATETSSTTNAIRDRTSATRDIPDESFLYLGDRSDNDCSR